MSNDLPAKTTLTWTAEGNRNRGRSKTTCRRTTEEELEAAGLIGGHSSKVSPKTQEYDEILCEPYVPHGMKRIIVFRPVVYRAVVYRLAIYRFVCRPTVHYLCRSVDCCSAARAWSLADICASINTNTMIVKLSIVMVIACVAIETVTCYKPPPIVNCHVKCVETYQTSENDCMEMKWCTDHCRHASPVAPPNPQNNSGSRPLYHLKTVQEAVGDATQYSVHVVDPRCNQGVNKSLASETCADMSSPLSSITPMSRTVGVSDTAVKHTSIVDSRRRTAGGRTKHDCFCFRLVE
ncbi:hypothetical protein LSAT2_024817 [Lamellibrachia satsuma]|nr:hypothetical protein LSAT2_024817 [Lamellibrachia satsuma]